TRNLPCQPCLSRRCRRGDHACLAGLSPDEVEAAARGLLGLAGDDGPRAGEGGPP
ncbi:MAG: hypothetical protein GX590_03650, partial [Lentisphaerae bacterium]|nr:hypothetical protein [Lentisphaerota bacterium]